MNVACNATVSESNTKHHDADCTAIFDLDGTLTTRDSFLAFLLTFGRRQRRYGSLGRLPFRVSGYLAKLTKDYRLKEALIRDFLAGIPISVIDDHAEWFCDRWLPHRMHPIGIQLLRWHQERGDRIILLSASPEIAVPVIAQRLGIRETVCTRLEKRDGSYSGKIDGENCKGEAKVRAIQEYLQRERPPTNTFAYGDSKSDRYILNWVQHGAWVRRNKIDPLSKDFTPFPSELQ